MAMKKAGWKGQTTRHSNAKKFGRAGGLYAKPKGRFKKSSVTISRVKTSDPTIPENKADFKVVGEENSPAGTIQEFKNFGKETNTEVIVQKPAPVRLLGTGAKRWNVDDRFHIETISESTRSGFRHIAVLYKDGLEVDRAKVTYQNRTWESYEFETVLKKLADDTTRVLTDKEQGKLQSVIKGGSVQARDEINTMMKTVGTVAQMGDLFGTSLKEKNDWKLRMIRAGNKGLILPENWNSLDEKIKKERLDKIIKFSKKGI